MKLRSHGLEADAPAGWDVRIYRRDPGAVAEGRRQPSGHPVLHAATFALPPGRGDFGSGAVERMDINDAFVALIEFEPAQAGTALFAAGALPRSLPPAAFGPNRLQRAIPGQAGAQRFFTEAGRPFCLYVVLGSYHRRALLAPRVAGLLAGLRVDP